MEMENEETFVGVAKFHRQYMAHRNRKNDLIPMTPFKYPEVPEGLDAINLTLKVQIDVIGE